MRDVILSPQVIADLEHFTRHDRKLALKILKLLEAVGRDPFAGVGKPEPLKGDKGGMWSRRIDREHRLVYEVADDRIVVTSARGHYDA